MAQYVKVLKDGKVTLPKQLREDLKIKEGDIIAIEVDHALKKFEGWKVNLK